MPQVEGLSAMASKRIVTVQMMKYSESLLRVVESGQFQTSQLILKGGLQRRSSRCWTSIELTKPPPFRAGKHDE